MLQVISSRLCRVETRECELINYDLIITVKKVLSQVLSLSLTLLWPYFYLQFWRICYFECFLLNDVHELEIFDQCFFDLVWETNIAAGFIVGENILNENIREIIFFYLKRTEQ